MAKQTMNEKLDTIAFAFRDAAQATDRAKNHDYPRMLMLAS